MDVKERIFYLLETQGKTARDLGLFIGVKPSSISAWKNEDSYPSSKYIVRISEFLEVSPTYLFTGKSEPFNSNVEVGLSDSEQELVDDYRKLDNRGRHMVHAAIYKELDRQEGILPQNKSAAG